jgi:predicted Fe-Mo cluster-binding NifX family protein
MKIAIPAFENGTLCPHFGHAPNFAVADVNTETKEINSIELLVPKMGGHEALPPWLKSLGVTVLIAGGIGARAIEFLCANQITVVAGAPELPIREVVTQWLAEQLNLNPQPCNHVHTEGCDHEHHHEHKHEHQHHHEHKHGQN